MLIGLLFVLLAADVRVVDVTAVGKAGVLVVVVLMFLVRPLNIMVCTAGSGLTWKEKAFLSWVAPRGIVAAAVASLFAERLSAIGADLGSQLRAMVFLVIAATVVLQGATAGLVARLLGVQRPGGRGYALFGAQPLGRLLARLLREHDEDVVVIDTDSRLCGEAEQEGLKVVYGNAMNENVLLRSQMDTRRAALGVTPNEAMNLLLTRTVRTEARVPAVYAVGVRGQSGVTPDHFRGAGVRLLFGNETDPDLWSVRVRRGLVAVETWRREDTAAGEDPLLPNEQLSLLLPLFLLDRKGRLEPVDETRRFARGRRVLWLLLVERGDEARAWLTAQGWVADREAVGAHEQAAADDPGVVS
jgi:hypothetical protein